MNKNELFEKQKMLLDTFLEHGTITRAQYDKSLGDLIIKMGIKADEQQSSLILKSATSNNQ